MRNLCTLAIVLAVSCSSASTTSPSQPMSNNKEINFAGLTWNVKSGRAIGPGPNNWSDSTDNVFVDQAGLHLRITHRDGIWYCAQVICTKSFGYGKYSFRTASNINSLDQNMVLGLYTYNDKDPSFANREIDIEFFGGKSVHFVVQPAERATNLQVLDFLQKSQLDTHSFDWRQNSVIFQNNEQAWEYSGPSVPAPGGETVRMNLWLSRGNAPTNGQEAEVVISNFRFEP